MECKAIRSSAYTATVLLVVGLLSCGSVADLMEPILVRAHAQ